MIVIVGDSFCGQDQNYKPSWSALLAKKYTSDLKNLSYPGASNFGILLQVEQALKLEPTFVIFNSTSSVRFEVVIRNVEPKNTLLVDRIINYDTADKSRDILSTTAFTANTLEQLNELQQSDIVSYYNNYVDLGLEIHKNYCFIRYTLDMLIDKDCAFLWSPGGFEHPKFSGSTRWDFKKYKQYTSEYNLWDYVDNQQCSHHIESADTHIKIFEYYDKKISGLL